MKHLLGIDIGTTGTKTSLFSEDGTLLGHAYQSYDLYTPRLEWREQDAEDWWMAVIATVRKVCGNQPEPLDVAAISLSTQGGTLVPVDSDFVPVCRAIVWNDLRCVEEREKYLHEIGPAKSMYEKTGWKLGNNSVVQRIRWLKDHKPDLFQRTAMFLTVGDYISYKMTGIPAVDLSNLGINRLGNIRKAAYDQELLRFAGISGKCLPQIVRTGDVIGHLTPQAAETLGLSPNTILAAGAHDQYAVALGAGANKAGDIMIGSGTAWVVTAISDKPDFESGFAQSVAAVPEKWGSLWSLSTGGICLEWLRKNLLANDSGDLLPYDVIDWEVERCKAAEDGLFFYPFSGRSAPDKVFTKASFVGLDLFHNRYHIARSIMEGIAFQIAWMLEAFQRKPSQDGLKLAGGAAKSIVWCQILADITGLPVRVPEVSDLACVGAAIIAGTSCGLFSNMEAGYERLAPREKVIFPDPSRVRMYQKQLEKYKQYAGILGSIYSL